MPMRPSHPSCSFVDSRLAVRLCIIPTPTPCSTMPHNHQLPPGYQQSSSKSSLRIAISTIHHPQFYLHAPYRLSPLPVWLLKPSSPNQYHSFSYLAPHWSRSRSPYSCFFTSVSLSVPHLCTIKPGLSVCVLGCSSFALALDFVWISSTTWTGSIFSGDPDCRE